MRADIHDRVASRTRPARQMKAHARVTLDPGERKVVTLAIPHAELALVAADGQWRVEPG
ncbi:fibronectin type III-like domain-contianing protein, partial [Escherichia coli]|uniref:fibronectin type III-like domain-contianing protein n=1 Tax=Escherichia coli TaxID=562 RepID=UPI001954B6AE